VILALLGLYLLYISKLPAYAAAIPTAAQPSSIDSTFQPQDLSMTTVPVTPVSMKHIGILVRNLPHHESSLSPGLDS
jgi:hypothetical protein